MEADLWDTGQNSDYRRFKSWASDVETECNWFSCRNLRTGRRTCSMMKPSVLLSLTRGARQHCEEEPGGLPGAWAWGSTGRRRAPVPAPLPSPARPSAPAPPEAAGQHPPSSYQPATEQRCASGASSCADTAHHPHVSEPRRRRLGNWGKFRFKGRTVCVFTNSVCSEKNT